MKRSVDLHVLSRRDLFAIAGCAGLAAVAACTDGSGGGVQTGTLGDNPGSATGVDAPGSDAPIDARKSGADASTGDASGPTPDASSAEACVSGSTETDVGAPSTFTSGTPVYFSSGKFFVVRDAGGLYAVTAVCTHEGATCTVSGGDYRCPRHGALFEYDGTIVSGPVSRELGHYAMCLLSNGHVGVTKTTCAKAQRLVA